MELKKGYTTGTCAAIAAKAALKMIFEQKIIKKESIITPKGIVVEVEIYQPEFTKNCARCAVRKYSGDDPDVTNGILIFADVKLNSDSIYIDGGIGVGRITKPGLYQKIGEAAINKVPREMIIRNTKIIFNEFNYTGGANIIISVPEGEAIAKKTFNSRLGIDGGISILGTSGIVEPMSEQAIIDTIKAEINFKKANSGDYIMIVPGNYGFDFIKNNYNVNINNAVKCSNFIGEALDFALEAGFKGILLIGHIGKFVKLAGGIMNTHSKNADARIEIIAANSALFCDNLDIVKNVMSCVTTDEAIDIIKKAGICDKVMERIVEKALFYINNRLKEKVEAAVLMFSNIYGVLGKTSNTDKMFEFFKDGV